MPFDDFSKPLQKTTTADPYLILGLDRRANESEIKRAYFQLVRQFPPESAPEKFQEIRAAYEQLRSSEGRSRIDLFLLQPPPPIPNRRRATYDLTVHGEDFVALARELAATAMEKDFRS